MSEGYWKKKPKQQVCWSFDGVGKHTSEEEQDEFTMNDKLKHLFLELQKFYVAGTPPKHNVIYEDYGEPPSEEEISEDFITEFRYRQSWSFRKEYLLSIFNAIAQHIANQERIKVNITYTSSEMNISFEPEKDKPSVNPDDILI